MSGEVISLSGCLQGCEAAGEDHERGREGDGEREEGVAPLRSQVQQLERENTDFLAALEDAMEQYKQQVRPRLEPDTPWPHLPRCHLKSC